MTMDFINWDVEYKPEVSWPPENLGPGYLYRFDGFGDDITCNYYLIHHETPKGVIIKFYNGKTKFINNSWKKKFAYPDPEEALEAFIYRKKKQIDILTFQLEKAKDHLKLAEDYIKNNQGELI